MAKKQNVPEQQEGANTAGDETERDAIQHEGEGGSTEFPQPTEDESGDFKFETDFNAEDEYKVPPLVPVGNYEGYVTAVAFVAADNALVWDVTLRAEEDVMMSDNETPVNGVVMQYKNWFPKKGDDLTRTKTGKMTKRQAKINMIQDFQKGMRIDMNTPEAILENVSNQEWVGMAVLVTVEIREYQGRFSNQIKQMVAA
jgi:hypothetical protein